MCPEIPREKSRNGTPGGFAAGRRYHDAMESACISSSRYNKAKQGDPVRLLSWYAISYSTKAMKWQIRVFFCQLMTADMKSNRFAVNPILAR